MAKQLSTVGVCVVGSVLYKLPRAPKIFHLFFYSFVLAGMIFFDFFECRPTNHSRSPIRRVLPRHMPAYQRRHHPGHSLSHLVLIRCLFVLFSNHHTKKWRPTWGSKQPIALSLITAKLVLFQFRNLVQ